MKTNLHFISFYSKRLQLLLFLFLSFSLHAQIENKKKSFVSKNSTEIRNEKTVPSLYALYNKGDEKKAYNKAHSLLKSSKNNHSPAYANLKTQEIDLQKNTQRYTIIAFLVFLISIAGLFFLYYSRLKTQRLLNEKQAELSAQKMDGILKEQELKLIKTCISIQDKERERISQELHRVDGDLAAIKLQLNHLSNSNLSNITDINVQLDETYQQIRNLSRNLIPKKFSQHEFCEVLESYLATISEAGNLKISFLTYPTKEINKMDEKILIDAFKIVQELLANTIKHAKATEIEVQLNLIPNRLNILFEDNGVDFNTNNCDKEIGFINLETRIKNLKGTFLIDSTSKKGTIANIEIPVLNMISKRENGVKGINVKNQLDELRGKFLKE